MWAAQQGSAPDRKWHTPQQHTSRGRKGQRGQNSATQQDSLYPFTQGNTGHFIVLSCKRSKLGHADWDLDTYKHEACSGRWALDSSWNHFNPLNHVNTILLNPNLCHNRCHCLNRKGISTWLHYVIRHCLRFVPYISLWSNSSRGKKPNHTPRDIFTVMSTGQQSIYVN